MPKSRSNRAKPIPRFASEDDEREFWAITDASEYFDASSARRVVFPNLKPSTATISLRLPQGMLNELKTLANARDVPYQSLLKVILAERLEVERKRRAG